ALRARTRGTRAARSSSKRSTDGPAYAGKRGTAIVMSHRTKDLPPLTGIGHTIRELRYQEIARQGLGIGLILVYALTARSIPLLVAIGAPLVLLGTIVRLYASGFILKNEQLAKHGPYALVRHPLYTGNVLVLVGFAFANGNWWSM